MTTMNPRRHFIKTAIGGTAGLIAIPRIFSGSLFAADSPNRRIQVAQIGCGRMGLADMNSIMSESLARVVAVCDVDSKRAAHAKEVVENFYKKKGESVVKVKVYSSYHELLANQEIDAVVNSTPDHWHGLIGVAAALAGKHIYGQKPLAYNIAEGIALTKAVRSRKVIFQTGSQQRSESPFLAFRTAIDAVRNGRVGHLKTVKIGIGKDKPSGKRPAAMPVPANLDYDAWLGSAPQQDYMEGHCHSQSSFDARPGWITTEDFGLGMITNWGAHHIDIAHLAMGQELGGPSSVDAKAQFMKDDVWTVHSGYHVEMQYPNGVQVILDDQFENGLTFEGDEGWIFCTRSEGKVTASDPNTSGAAGSDLRASDAKLLSPLSPGGMRMPKSANHYRNWLESIVRNEDPIAPVDQAACSLEACASAWISMKLGRKVEWNAARKDFGDDREANALRSRTPRRAEFDIQALLKSAGI